MTNSRVESGYRVLAAKHSRTIFQELALNSGEVPAIWLSCLHRFSTTVFESLGGWHDLRIDDLAKITFVQWSLKSSQIIIFI